MPLIAPGYYLLNDFMAMSPVQLTKRRIVHQNRVFQSAAQFSKANKCNAISLLGDLLEEGISAFAVEDEGSKIITIWQEKFN